MMMMMNANTKSQTWSHVREAERAANDCGCRVVKMIIANSSPDTVVVQFKTSFSWTRAAHQSHCKRHTSQYLTQQTAEAPRDMDFLKFYYIYVNFALFNRKTMLLYKAS